MKKLLRKNQIIITALVIMVAVAGYLSLAGGEDSILTVNDTFPETEFEETMTDISDEDIKTAQEGEEEAMAASGAAVKEEKTETASKENAGEAVMVGTTVGSNYFESAKLSREQTRAKNKETLLELANSTNVTEKQKEKAMNEIVDMTAVAEKETATENLLAAKGFESVIVSIVDDSVDVIVDATDLTGQQIAQIEDIVKRKTEVSSDKIVISPVGKKE